MAGKCLNRSRLRWIALPSNREVRMWKRLIASVLSATPSISPLGVNSAKGKCHVFLQLFLLLLTFVIVKELASRNPLGGHIRWKCFAFILEEESRKFQTHRDRLYIHHLVWYCVHSAHCYTGVEYCLFVRGFARAPLQINELLHTFLCISGYGATAKNKMYDVNV